MNETSALQVTLLQAFETAQPANVNWTADDSAWATRMASSDAKIAPSRSASQADSKFAAADESHIALRAHHAMQRLLPREAVAAKWMARRQRGWPWLTLAVAGAFGLGLLADSLGSAQRINLLAPPLWGLVLWNALVYALLLIHWIQALAQREPRVGWLTRWTQTLTEKTAQTIPQRGHGGTKNEAAALQSFAALWTRRSMPLSVQRATTLLHAGSAALALGLIAGMYLHGLVLDYQASWESTFLSAQTAHAVLSFLLSPAAALARLELPSLAAFEALRSAHLSSASSSASGASWIHLYAVTLLMFVVLPRLALSAYSALRTRWLAGHVKLPLGDAYFARLLRQHRGRQTRVEVHPYASLPSELNLTGLTAVLKATFGPDTTVHFKATLAYGAEDDAKDDTKDDAKDGAKDITESPSGSPSENPRTVAAGTSVAVALFDLSATPEAENQGRFAQQLATSTSTVVVIDEAAFQRRFTNAPERLEQRRAAWRAWASALATQAVFMNFEQLDLKNAERDLLMAMTEPVRK